MIEINNEKLTSWTWYDLFLFKKYVDWSEGKELNIESFNISMGVFR